MARFIPLARPCLAGIIARPDNHGDFCWSIEGTQWQYRQNGGMMVQVFFNQQWHPLLVMPTLNNAVAFSLGWFSRGISDLEQAVKSPAATGRQTSDAIDKTTP